MPPMHGSERLMRLGPNRSVRARRNTQRLQHLTGDVVVENYPLRSLGRDDKVLPKECLRAALDSLALEFVCVAAAPGEEKDCGIRLGVYWG
jgi:hypothetical protein